MEMSWQSSSVSIARTGLIEGSAPTFYSSKQWLVELSLSWIAEQQLHDSFAAHLRATAGHYLSRLA